MYALEVQSNKSQLDQLGPVSHSYWSEILLYFVKYSKYRCRSIGVKFAAFPVLPVKPMSCLFLMRVSLYKSAKDVGGCFLNVVNLWIRFVAHIVFFSLLSFSIFCPYRQIAVVRTKRINFIRRKCTKKAAFDFINCIWR